MITSNKNSEKDLLKSHKKATKKLRFRQDSLLENTSLYKKKSFIPRRTPLILTISTESKNTYSDMRTKIDLDSILTSTQEPNLPIQTPLNLKIKRKI